MEVSRTLCKINAVYRMSTNFSCQKESGRNDIPTDETDQPTDQPNNGHEGS